MGLAQPDAAGHHCRRSRAGEADKITGVNNISLGIEAGQAKRVITAKNLSAQSLVALRKSTPYNDYSLSCRITGSRYYRNNIWRLRW